MSWGDVFSEAWNGAADGAKAVVQQGAKLMEAGERLVVSAAKKTAAASFLGAEATSVKTAQTVGSAYSAVKERFSPHKSVDSACLACPDKDSAEARRQRINMRNNLIAHGKQSGDPNLIKRAEALQDDMAAVDMASLSSDAYREPSSPPQPWRALSDKELADKGIKKSLLTNAKAKVYQLPADFPGGPKTVLAFRGTVPDTDGNPADSDLIADHDQAMGLGSKNKQFVAATELGLKMGDAFPGAEVTGHSLGGAKAQAAGAAGGLHGMMFNSAGLHPATVPDVSLDGAGKGFKQYRSSGDPLTGLQNSPKLQSAAYGLVAANAWSVKELGLEGQFENFDSSVKRGLADRVLNVTAENAAHNKSTYGWYVPPARGEIFNVPAKAADGEDVGVDPMGQHSVDNLINGLEARKNDNVSALS